MLRSKQMKKISQKVKFNFQKNINKYKITIKKILSNQWKENIHVMYYLKEIYNFKFVYWSNMIFSKTFFLNWLYLIQIYRNTPLKMKKFLYFLNIFTNFDKILFSIFDKCQKTLMFSFFYSKNKNSKQKIKNFLCLLQKKFLNKKLKFAILLLKILFKNVKKFLKNSIAKFYFNFLKNLHLLFIQLFLELQFSFFLILKNSQNFLVEKNVLQIFLQKHFLTKKKKQNLIKFRLFSKSFFHYN